MRLVVRVMLACVLLAGVTFAGKHGKQSGDSEDGSFRSGLIGSVPGLTIGGVASGSAAWTLKSGKATVTPHGELQIEVEGLLLISTGTTGPVTQVSASLVCGGSGGTVVATTPAVDLSAEGRAEIEAKITLPGSCFGTVILVRVAGVNGTPLPTPLPQAAPFIAVTGFNGETGGGGDGDR